jgi:hypothetical protein
MNTKALGTIGAGGSWRISLGGQVKQTRADAIVALLGYEALAQQDAVAGLCFLLYFFFF